MANRAAEGAHHSKISFVFEKKHLIHTAASALALGVAVVVSGVHGKPINNNGRWNDEDQDGIDKICRMDRRAMNYRADRILRLSL